MLRDDGIFFSDVANAMSGCEIPAGSGNHVAYTTSFWMTAVDMNGYLYAACNTYGVGDDFFPGPVSDNYNSAYYTDNFTNSIWKVTRAQVNYHVANYTTVGYTPDPAIANWPGNGNTTEGVAAQLAPYADVNGDQLYNPMDGDFPYIQGDEAVYVIMNDEAGVHTQTGGTPFGAEIHAMFYQYATTDDLNNTTFLNVKLYNRRTSSYYSFRFGLFMDTDIGNPMDDFIGCDSARSLAYGYNGDANDEPANGQPGYGTNPPAFGAKLLNDAAGAIMSFNNSSGPMGNPNTTSDYDQLLQAHYLDGTLLMNGTTPTKFIYSGNPYTNTGWTEANEGNVPSDRRVLIASKETIFYPQGNLCYDVAFVFNQETGNNLENVNELLNTADFVQNYYNDNIQPCNQILLDNQTNEPASQIAVYPNPSGGSFTIQSEEVIVLSVFDLEGRVIQANVQTDPSGQVNLNLNNGIYIFELRTETGVTYKRVEIQK